MSSFRKVVHVSALCNYTRAAFGDLSRCFDFVREFPVKFKFRSETNQTAAVVQIGVAAPIASAEFLPAKLPEDCLEALRSKVPTVKDFDSRRSPVTFLRHALPPRSLRGGLP